MTVFGFASGEYSYADSGWFVEWADRDGYPASARNYAHEVFSYDEDLDETTYNILDELDDYFGIGKWHFSDDASRSVAVANEDTEAFPFTVRQRVVLVLKYHDGVNGWTEKPYRLLRTEPLMAPAVEPKVFHEL